jgi:hypothetical protein
MKRNKETKKEKKRWKKLNKDESIEEQFVKFVSEIW